MRARLGIGIGVAICALPWGSAQAFVCSRGVDSATSQEVGPSLSWAVRELPFALNEAGTADITSRDEMNVLRTAFQVWEGVTECRPAGRSTDIQFTEATQLTSEDLVGFNFLAPDNNSNVLMFRDDAWPHRGQGDLIIALTTTTYGGQTGQILDADIEFNSANFEFTIGDSGVVTDLMNTAVHEIGHILGLGHTGVSGATMEATARDGDTDKRTLECDDRDGIVFKYPAGEPNGYCTPPSCAVGRPECGSCSAGACSDWLDCGFCAPPNPLTTTTKVTVTGFDDGAGGCDCDGASTPLLAVVALLSLRRRQRRRSLSS